MVGLGQCKNIYRYFHVIKYHQFVSLKTTLVPHISKHEQATMPNTPKRKYIVTKDESPPKKQKTNELDAIIEFDFFREVMKLPFTDIILSQIGLMDLTEKQLCDRKLVMRCMHHDGMSLKYSSVDLQKDRHIVLAAVKQNGNSIKYASVDLRKDPLVALAAVEQNGLALRWVSEDLKGDKDTVLAAVRKNGKALFWASNDMKRDREVVMVAVEQSGIALFAVPNYMRMDKEVVLIAVGQNGEALEYASYEMRRDKDVVLAAVKQNGKALGHASYGMTKDKEVVLAAVKQDGKALSEAAYEMREDKEVVLAALKQNGLMLPCVSYKLREDKEVVLAALSQIALVSHNQIKKFKTLHDQGELITWLNRKHPTYLEHWRNNGMSVNDFFKAFGIPNIAENAHLNESLCKAVRSLFVHMKCVEYVAFDGIKLYEICD